MASPPEISIDPEIAEHARRVSDAWRSAEDALKLAESLNDSIIPPAMKELQAVGRSITGILGELERSDKESIIRTLDSARASCMAARADVISVAVSAMSLGLSRFYRRLNSKAYRRPEAAKLNVLMRVKDFGERLRRTASEVANSKKGDPLTLTNEELVKLFEDYLSLVQISDFLAAQERQRQVRVLMLAAIGLVGALVGSMAFGALSPLLRALFGGQ